MRKVLVIFGVIILIAGITIGVVVHDHPIFLKYLLGEASNLEKPINAKVYTDGRITNDIKVYKDIKYKNDYLLHLKNHDSTGMLEYIDIDLNYKFVGRTICSAKDCYDTINGDMFQSETGAIFADFKDDMKGFNFDPKLTFSDHEIKLTMPPHWLKFDSLRIELNNK
ncbi:MAG: hypothetical protein JST50_03375 [Bacteroidetes bacterium]|jgi:hypothetical protein|nr:hypothetical protein [Bacteroidota bacterium]